MLTNGSKNQLKNVFLPVNLIWTLEMYHSNKPLPLYLLDRLLKNINPGFCLAKIKIRQKSNGNLYPVYVVIWVAFTPPLAGVAAVPAAIRLLQQK